MRLFDTHCHFESDDPAVIAAIIARARAAGVERMMAVGGSAVLNRTASLAGDRGCLVAQGFDREQAGRLVDRAELLPTERLSAWGEIGLDYHYSPDTRPAQLKLFGEELEEAKRRNLPVVIHTREAAEDTIAMLREIPSRGIIHCFTGDPGEARAYLDLGFCISISGIVTFRAADNVRASALVVPDDRILIETDSPYLAPVPMRGNPNEPAFIRHTCEFLAKLRNVSADAFAELTFANAERILGK